MEPEALRRLVAEKIRLLAQRRAMSLNQLADFAGIERSAFYKALGGQQAMTTDRIAKIAEALEVEPHDLLRAADDEAESWPRAANPRTK